MTRALFVNSGMAGHRTFAGLMKQVAGQIDGLEARHLDLSRDLTTTDRVIRRVCSLALAPSTGPAANLDLRRWREEFNVGWLAARRIAREERRSTFDVMHFYTQPSAYASLATMKQVPAIVCLDCTQRQASFEVPSRLGRASYYANVVHDGRVFRAASAIVATSEWAARDLADLYPDCVPKVNVLPCPVAVDMFSADWIAERAARARRGQRPRALFIGGDFPRKGGPELLEAWREGALGDRADLDVVTDWPLRGEDLPPGVAVKRGIAPYTDRWFELWRLADLFVMPVKHEAFGIVYEEAAASGIPAIGSDVNAVPELIERDVTGLLVPPGDRASLVGALRALIDSSTLRERMGHAARRYVHQRAAVSVHAARLASIIGRVVTHGVRQHA